MYKKKFPKGQIHYKWQVHESKIPWKIRDTKKKRQKHITLGLTREEFAHIQESLRHRPVKCKKSHKFIKHFLNI